MVLSFYSKRCTSRRKQDSRCPRSPSHHACRSPSRCPPGQWIRRAPARVKPPKQNPPPSRQGPLRRQGRLLPRCTRSPASVTQDRAIVLAVSLLSAIEASEIIGTILMTVPRFPAITTDVSRRAISLYH